MKTKRLKEGQTDKQRDEQKIGLTDWQTERLTDKQTD